ncbi:hypothetical protein NMY22_g7999 [Coprinellus aureogranulatus]|nr:hypothetical protein NMY22_g7999 [Coprinellus aureogranulatus]
MMQMPPTLSRIFGWEPPANECYVEVDIPAQPPTHQLPAFHMSDNSAPMEPSSPASSVSALSDDQADKPNGTGKKGDPNWVARPRNEFILFRCDYVRKHTKDNGGKRNRRAPGQEAEKTLSKLAAEAWRALSSEERAYWREQANLERNDHARKYPDYRYRPKKSATARKRQSRSSMATHVVTRSMPAPAIVDRVTVSRSPSFDPSMTVVRRGCGPLYLDNTIRKATSVPVLPSTRPGDWLPLSLQPIQNSFDARMHPSNVNAFHQPIHPLQHSQSFDSLNLATPALSECMSIPDSTSSSLINWNGESPILAPQPTQYIDPLNLPLHASFTSDASMQSPVLGSGQQKYLDAVAGGHPRPPSHDQQLPNGDVQWGGPGTMYQSAHAIGGMPIMRTSSQHSLGGGEIPQHNPSGSGLQLYDSFGKFHPPMPPSGVTVVPGEYLIRPAEIAPDEVFLMDREPEYVTSF